MEFKKKGKFQSNEEKPISKKGQKENLSETQREIFTISAISKTYERVKKIQNKKFQEKIS